MIVNTFKLITVNVSHILWLSFVTYSCVVKLKLRIPQAFDSPKAKHVQERAKCFTMHLAHGVHTGAAVRGFSLFFYSFLTHDHHLKL